MSDRVCAGEKGCVAAEYCDIVVCLNIVSVEFLHEVWKNVV